jgi:hypothetical protein
METRGSTANKNLTGASGKNGKFWKRGIFCLLLALSCGVIPTAPLRADNPEKYALVIGGASKQAEPEYQEFGRNTAAVTEGLTAKGYQVLTLFGGPAVQGSAAAIEKNKYPVDYSKIDSLQQAQAGAASPNDARHTTEAGIDAALANMVAKVKSGDRVEIYVTAHGADSCGDLGVLIRNDLGSGCQHTFTVFDSQGKEIQYPTEKIIAALKKLEAKGALPTLVLDSCHSGRAMNAFKTQGLTKTCAYFETAGNETGYGCFENDPPFVKDYTSTGEYISMRYYQSILSHLKQDPYFSSDHSACFGKTLKHFQDKNMNLSTIESAYWSSRSFDATFESPSISSLIGMSYFSTGEFSPFLPESKPLSCTQVNLELDSIVRQLPEVQSVANSIQMSVYRQAIGDYNAAVEKLAAALSALKAMPNPSQEATKNAADLQAQVRVKASTVIEGERALVQAYYQQGANSDKLKNPSCERTL